MSDPTPLESLKAWGILPDGKPDYVCGEVVAKLCKKLREAEDELAEAVKDKVKAESEVRRLRERIRKLWTERDRLREAGESLLAAMWDAHYGRGIATQYAQAADKEWGDALAGKEGK